MSNSSIWPIDRTLSGATTPGQSGSGSNGNEGVYQIPQSSIITGALPFNFLASYPGHFEETYPSAEMQSVHSIAPAVLFQNRVSIWISVWDICIQISPPPKISPCNIAWIMLYKNEDHYQIYICEYVWVTC